MYKVLSLWQLHFLSASPCVSDWETWFVDVKEGGAGGGELGGGARGVKRGTLEYVDSP